MNGQDWLSATDIAGLPGLPTTDRGVHKAADREGWNRRRRQRGKGWEYHINSLPTPAQFAIAARQTKIDTAAARAGRAAAAELIADERHVNGEPVSLVSLTGRARSRAEAKLAILDALAAYMERSGRAPTAAVAAFATHYGDGTLAIEPWIRDLAPQISPATLWRWRGAARREGAGRLGGRYGNRRGSGKIDAHPDLLALAEAMVAEYPHVQAKALHRAILARYGDAGLQLPSASACARWLGRWKIRHASLYTAINNPDAWKSRYMPAFGSASEDIHRLNQRWELDSTPADVLLADGRHHVIGVIDVYSRRAKLLVAQTSKAVAIASLVRRAILDWGVPETAKHDNGADYTSHHVQRVWDMLDVQPDLCRPFAGWEKPHIERFFRSFAHGLIELMPGYCGHNVAERQAIEARTSFADRLMQRGQVIRISKTAAELQEFCDRWLEAVYHRDPHSGLGGVSPMERAAGQPARRVDNERALDILLAPAAGDNGHRVVGKKGIRVDGLLYIAPELGDLVGEPVLVLEDASDLGYIQVFADLGEGMRHVCVAQCPEVTGVSRQAIAAETRARRTHRVEQQRRELKRRAKDLNVKNIAFEILASREAGAGRVTPLPGREEGYDSEGLTAAAQAAEARERIDAPAAATAVDPDAHAQVARWAAASDTKVETPETRWARWLELHRAGHAGETPAEAAWRVSYETTSEFHGRHMVWLALGDNQSPANDEETSPCATKSSQ